MQRVGRDFLNGSDRALTICTGGLLPLRMATVKTSGRNSFLSHVVDKHEDLPDDLFNKCAHSNDIPERKWLDEGRLKFHKNYKINLVEQCETF